jgi:precorrin-2/cobalt-factor-2 C20-methyltransferase
MLVGLGLGPGDPELLTLRAARLLTGADRVYVPGGIARKLVEPYRDPEVLEFPMSGGEARIRRCLEENADRIAPHALRGLAVFALLGDPCVYSTFSRLAEVVRERWPDVEITTVPGVSSLTAAASVAGISLSRGFTVSDGPEPSDRILLKVQRPRETAARLRAEGYRTFVLVERMYLDGMQVYRGDDLPEESDYFSILLARR